MIPLLALLLGCPPDDCPDSDADGVCDSEDACTGDDTTGDADADGVCDSDDVCTGDDATGDADMDGTCDDIDACPNPLETDGSCIVVLAALTADADWASILSASEEGVCPPAGVNSVHRGAVEHLQSDLTGSGYPFDQRAVFSWDTAGIPATAEVQSVDLRIVHLSSAGPDLPIQLYGGPQPLFDQVTDGAVAYASGSVMLDSIRLVDVAASGFLDFSIGSDQINVEGRTAFLLRFTDPCPLAEVELSFVSPTGSAQGAPPTLTIRYMP